MDPASVDLQEYRCESDNRSTIPHHRHAFITSRYIWIHHTHVWRPPTDVFESDGSIQVQVEVAGMENSDFAVVLDGSVLRISGTRKDHSERRVYHQMEIHTGEFLSEVDLPARVDPEFIHADYHDGFLHIELHKSQNPQEGIV
jgi:HSP20 family molecular chaperone IbpA